MYSYLPRLYIIIFRLLVVEQVRSNVSIYMRLKIVCSVESAYGIYKTCV